MKQALWRPDAFSETRTKWAAVSATEASKVLQMWSRMMSNSDPLLDIEERIEDSANSRNFRLTTHDKSYILKSTSHSPTNLLQLQSIRDLSHKCEAFGRCFPRVVASYIQEEKRPGEKRIWTAFEFIPGDTYSGSVFELPGLPGLFRRLDTFLLQVEAGYQQQIEDLPSVTYKDLDQDSNLSKLVISTSQLKSYLTIEEIKLLECARDEISKALESYARRDSLMCSTKQERIVHIDLHPKNVIVSKNNELILLDVFSLYKGDKDLFLGYGIFKLLRQSLVKTQNPKLVLLMRDQLLDFLFKNNKTTNIRLASLVQIEILRRLFLILNEIVISGGSAWRPMLPVMCRALKESEALFMRSPSLDTLKQS